MQTNKLFESIQRGDLAGIRSALNSGASANGRDPTLVRSSVPHTDYIGKMAPVETMNGVPLWKPPYGRVTAIDLNTGDHRWMTPVGDLAEEVTALKELGLKNLGRPARGHLLLTKSLLIVGQEGSTHREGGPEQVPKFQVVSPNLVAFDKNTGKRVGEVELPRNATAAALTYMHQGKQYLVVAQSLQNPFGPALKKLISEQLASAGWPVVML